MTTKDNSNIASPQFLEEGTKAPAFTTVDQDGKSISLSDYAGQKVAICFYVNDGTKACDNELLNLQSNLPNFKKANLQVLAVSQNDQETHAKNAKKLKITFPLLVDTDHKIIKAYKVWGKKNMYGSIYEGVHRSAYIIDEKGIIMKTLRKVTSTKAAEQILAALNKK